MGSCDSLFSLSQFLKYIKSLYTFGWQIRLVTLEVIFAIVDTEIDCACVAVVDRILKYHRENTCLALIISAFRFKELCVVKL